MFSKFKELKFDQKSSLFIVLIIFLAFLLPRILLIMRGFAFQEDWFVDTNAYLDSYRPFAALYFDINTWLLGENFSSTIFPRIFSAIWLSLACFYLLRVFVIFGGKVHYFLLSTLLIAFHPIFNERVLWGVTATGAFSLFISCLGLYWVYNKQSRVYLTLGISLICLAAQGTQLLIMFSACIVIMELAFGKGGLSSLSRKGSILVRSAMLVLPGLMALLVYVYMRHVLGFSDFDDRRLLIGFADPDYISEKFRVLSNAYANFYQAQLGVIVGEVFSKSVFIESFIALFLFSVFFLNRNGLGIALIKLFCVYLIVLVSLLPLLASSANPTGYRISGFSFILFVYALTFMLHDKNRALNATSIAALYFLFLSVSLYTSLKDLDHRKNVWEKDLILRNELTNLLADQQLHGNDLRVCLSQSLKSDNRKGIVRSYNVVSNATYSNWNSYSDGILRAFVADSGFPVGHMIKQSGEMCFQECAYSSPKYVSSNMSYINTGEDHLVCLK